MSRKQTDQLLNEDLRLLCSKKDSTGGLNVSYSFPSHVREKTYDPPTVPSSVVDNKGDQERAYGSAIDFIIKARESK